MNTNDQENRANKNRLAVSHRLYMTKFTEKNKQGS